MPSQIHTDPATQDRQVMKTAGVQNKQFRPHTMFNIQYVLVIFLTRKLRGSGVSLSGLGANCKSEND